MKERKLLSAVLAASLLASTVPATAWASEPNTEPVAAKQASARSGELTVSGDSASYEWQDNGQTLVIKGSGEVSISGDTSWGDTHIQIKNDTTANLKFSGVTIADKNDLVLEQGSTANIECENSTITAYADQNTTLKLGFIDSDNYYEYNSIEGIYSNGDVVLDSENGSATIYETIEAKNVTINNGRYSHSFELGVAIDTENLVIQDGIFSGIAEEDSYNKLARTINCTIHGGTFSYSTGDGSVRNWKESPLIEATNYDIDGGIYTYFPSYATLSCADIAENTVFGCPVAKEYVLDYEEINDTGRLQYKVIHKDQVKNHYNVFGNQADYSYEGRKLILKDGADVTVSSDGQICDQIVLEGNRENPTSATLTLAGVDFYGPMPAIIVSEGCDLTIVLQDGSDNSCEICWIYRAAIEAKDEATLTICGNGALTAESPWQQAAAIGTSEKTYGAEINIEGGTIYAHAGRHAAAIGGGLRSDGVKINISGGNITALGTGPDSGGGTGIGSGYSGSGTSVNISGGDIYAKSYDGAAIGGGFNSTGTSISIKGGNITAEGPNGAAIGGGYNAQISAIQISGEETVINASGSVGIGSDTSGTVGDIDISGGTISAKGGTGIGGGDSVGSIEISGGTVDAYGSRGAGIGAGYGGVAGTFSTGDGNPVIITNSISDQNSESVWNGVFIVDNMNGGVGKVYGNKVTPTNDFTIPEGKTLEVDAGQSLIVAKGITATNKGTVIRDTKGTVDVQGTWRGNPVVVRGSEEDVAVTGVQLNKRTLTLAPTATETLIATISPEDAANKSLRWSSSDSDVATVDANGKVTAVAEGQAVITVSTVDGGFTAQCTVTVSGTEEEKPGDETTNTETTPDGSTVTTTVDKNGVSTTTIQLSETIIEQAERNDMAVILPMVGVNATTSMRTAPSVTVDLPTSGATKVEIPVLDMTPGTVAVLVDERGNETVIKNSVIGNNGLIVTLADGDTVKILDNTQEYSDVAANHWAKDNIDYVTSRGLFVGVDAENFAPETSMTRAMIVSVLQRYAGDTTSASGNWYEGARQWAMENGISDGTNMNGNVTREQLVTMLYRYIGSPQVVGSLADYSDNASVSPYAEQAMVWAVRNGIIGGMTADTLAPQGLATRAQVAAILERFIAWEQA